MNITTDAFAPAPRKARVEIIPLIDVIFFLLATFVLFTLSLNKIASIDVTMPKAGTPNNGPDSTVYIQASSPGTFYWKLGKDSGAELIFASEIPARLADYKRSVPEPRVLVRGDGTATFGPAVTVLDQVRRSGIREVSLETLVSPTGR